MLRNWMMAAAIIALGTGCYFEEIDDRAPGAPVDDAAGRTGGRSEAGSCTYAVGKGCFDGHVLSKTEFYVEGRQFFNADEFAARFAELIKVDLPEGMALVDNKVSIEFTTRVDNQSFLQGFEFYLAGDTVKSGKVRSNGSFGINDLPEGTYSLRVHKPIRFKLRGQLVAVQEPADDADHTDQPDGDGGEPADGDDGQPENEPAAPQVTNVEKNFCATIYHDNVVEVRRGTRKSEIFSDFRLHYSDHECQSDGGTTSLSLKP